MASGDEASDEATPQTNLPSVDKSDAETPSSGDDSSDAEGSVNDSFDVEQSPLGRLFSEISRDQDPPSEASLAKLGDLLLECSSEVKTRYANGETALHIAARYGFIDAAQKLIEDGASVSAKDEDERQPLHRACFEGHTELARMLIEKGANIEARQNIQSTPLDEACWQGHISVVDLLLDRNANTQVIDMGGQSPVYSASLNGHGEIIRHLLLKDKSNINAIETAQYGWTALHSAVSNQYPEVVSILINYGADVNLPDKDGQTALHVACVEGYKSIVKLLVEAETKLDLQDTKGHTALHFASEKGSESIVELLVEAGANVDLTNKDGQTALHFASSAPEDDQSQQSPDRMEHDDPTVNEEHSEESQSDRYSAIIRHLLGGGADPRAQNNEGETAVHLAAAYSKPDRLKLLLRRMNQGGILIKNNKGQTALYSAFEGDRRETTADILIKLGKPVKDDALVWAAGNPETHDVAKLLFQKESTKMVVEDRSAIGWAAHEQHPQALSLLISSSPRTDATKEQLESALVSTLKDLAKSPHEGAVSDQVSTVLWLLITHSTQTKSIDVALGPALESVNALHTLLQSDKQQKSQTLRAAPNRRQGWDESSNQDKDNDQVQTSHTAKRTEARQKDGKLLESKNLKDIVDILRSPPFGAARAQKDWVLSDRKDYQFPQPKEDDNGNIHKVLKSLEASIIQFSKSEGVSKILQVYQPLKEVIYDVGPKGIMRTAAKMQQRIDKLKGVAVDAVEIGPEFTWVHLPSTNMDWMNDLMTRIMKDKKCGNTRYHQLRSFFRDSWTEVPDRETPSRIMRPRAIFRKQDSGTDDTRDKEGNTPEKKVRKETEGKEVEEGDKKPNFGKPFRKQDSGTDDTRDKEGNTPEKKVRKETEGKEVEEGDKKPNFGKPQPKTTSPDASAIYMPYLCFSTHYEGKHQTKQNYESLLEACKENGSRTSSAHESPTLDEWYYHFATDKESKDDKERRNRDQIVTKFQKFQKLKHKAVDPKAVEPETVEPKASESNPNQWALLRVNQLWVWTIDNEWLITATSCQLDENPRTLVDEILVQLEKQAEYGGSWSQTGSVSDMSKLIVEHCIGSYERKPESACLSIAQTFSDHMNNIGRDETKLFEDFSHHAQSWQQQPQNGGEGNSQNNGEINDEKGSSQKETPNEAVPGKPSGDDVRTATKGAEGLYCDIKDVRDELNILKAVADYQKLVQKGVIGGLTRSEVKDADLSATYVVNELKELDIVADRIQSSINTTLSLQQSDQAAKQGKILMVFTFATLLFLPLSFLSSLFALDVSSFLQTPDWAFLVLFLVSIAISVFVALVACCWGPISKVGKGAWNLGKRAWKKTKRPWNIVKALARNMFKGLAKIVFDYFPKKRGRDFDLESQRAPARENPRRPANN